MFPPDRMLADPDNVLYDALGLNKGVRVTFFDRATPYAIWEDITSGKIEDLKGVMREWVKYKLWIPPKQDQAFIQGGVFVFEGDTCVWSYRDPATGAHASFDAVFEALGICIPQDTTSKE
jgi:hypothetical protein